MRLNTKTCILLDKPAGMTSFECCEKVKEIVGAKKAGHSGTLDPNVTGLLIIAVDEAVKAMPLLIGQEKEYVGTMHVHGDVAAEKIKNAMKNFEGRIKQLPPRKSRVARKQRERFVRFFKLEKKRGRDVDFRVRCEAGTYVRKLVHDLGVKLGCGAHMKSLRRVKIGNLDVSMATSFNEVEKGKGVFALEEILDKLEVKKVSIFNEFRKNVRNGNKIRKSWLKEFDGSIRKDSSFAIMDEDGNLLAVGKALVDFSSINKFEDGDLVARPDRVLL